MSTLLAQHHLGNLLVRYIQPPNSTRCELQLIPAAMEGKIQDPRKDLQSRFEVSNLPVRFHPMRADAPNSLVQMKLREDNTGRGFASGVTLIESGTMDTLDYTGQNVSREDDLTTITTTLSDRAGRFRCDHHLRYRAGEASVTCQVTFTNLSPGPLSLEMLSSFVLNSITPFSSGNCTPHLRFHRFRSWWSAEGRTESTPLETMHHERSWGGFSAVNERFGQVGTMPVRKWFSTAALEDQTCGVVWAAQLAWAGSWQMELFRRGDRVHLAGGLADREFGHWVKVVAAGESFSTPTATLTAVVGNLDDACHALLDRQREAMKAVPAAELELPTAFNEWCTSWGSPTHENILAIARRLQGTDIRYIVIDDGWAKRPKEARMQSNGEWVVDEEKFPGGLRATCDALRELGFIPGIWFEFEVVNPGAASVWDKTDHLLQRDARALQVGIRRFWDLNDPWTIDFLTQRMINLLRENGIGYLKVDYNDNIGLGCDHPDSLGEGLRRHVEGIYAFFRRLREALPDLVIENCSSGGHRLEPSMQALCSVGSFSDAHEGSNIPIIARNLQRVILPRQSSIWAVLRPQDDAARLHYSLAATFLGRVCISGDIHDLADWQMHILREGLTLYQRVIPIIRDGRSYFHGDEAISYVDPQGWQAVVRVHGREALVVAHGFGAEKETLLNVPLPAGNWSVVGQFASAGNTFDPSQQGRLTLQTGFQGAVWLLEKTGK